MRTGLTSLFLAIFLIQAWSMDESVRSNLMPEFIEYLELLGELEPIAETQLVDDTTEPQLVGDLTPYLTADFSSWLQENGYGSFNFERTDISGGSFGGKSKSTEKITKRPVIFFHGNSDKAMGNEGDQFNGWTDSLNYFLSQGYKESELYATTWGPANSMLASQQYHSYDYLNYLRKFTEAVLNYTKAEKIDVIAHSMGVTLARKVIKGGTGTDGSSYDLGASIADKVNTFVGIAGGNWGLVSCYLAFTLPTCAKANGFYPGIAANIGLSTYLNALNTDTTKEGDYVVSLLSTADDLIMYGDKVWGKYTSQFPTEDDSLIYTNLTHMELKSTTCAEQYKIVTQHEL